MASYSVDFWTAQCCNLKNSTKCFAKQLYLTYLKYMYRTVSTGLNIGSFSISINN